MESCDEFGPPPSYWYANRGLGSAGRRYLDLTIFRQPLQKREARKVKKIGQSTNMIRSRQQRPNLSEQGTNALGISTYVHRIGSQELSSSYRGSRLEIGAQLPTDSISSSSIFFCFCFFQFSHWPALHGSWVQEATPWHVDIKQTTTSIVDFSSARSRSLITSWRSFTSKIFR